MKFFASKRELPALHKISALYHLHFCHGSTEAGILEVSIRYFNGDDITPPIAFLIGRELERELQKDERIQNLPEPRETVNLEHYET